MRSTSWSSVSGRRRQPATLGSPNASRLTRPRRAPRLVPPRGAIGGPTMRQADDHVLIPTLKRQLVDRLIDRREFLRYAALLGMSATAAYAFVRKVTGEPLVARSEEHTSELQSRQYL